MKTVSRTLSYISALLGILIAARPHPVALFPKMAANIAVPFVLVAGAVGGLVSWLRGDRRAAFAGLSAALVAGQYLAQNTAPHDKFEETFGADWDTAIPHHLRKRMLTSRRTFSLPKPLNVRWQCNLCIATLPGTGDPLLADLWEPPSDVRPSGLGIVYLHNSAWRFMDKDYLTRPFFRHLASQGHVILDVAYTLCPKAQLYEQVGDTKRAIAWLKTNAKELGVNPERIVLIGASAGGHLSLLAAYTPNFPEFQPSDVKADTSVRAVVSYYGPTDLLTMQDYLETAFANIPEGGLVDGVIERMVHRIKRFVPPYGQYVWTTKLIPDLVGGTPTEVPDLYYLGSPITYVRPDCPPTLQLQGLHDLDGIVVASRDLHGRLLQAGATSIYLEYPNTGHAFDMPLMTPAGLSALYDTERFLALMA